MEKPECYGKNPDCVLSIEGFDCPQYHDCFNQTHVFIAVRNVRDRVRHERELEIRVESILSEP